METRTKIIISAATTLLIALIIIPLFVKYDRNERITAVSWYREVHVSEWKTVSKTGSYVPDRGRQTDTWVESRKSCNGYKDGKCTGYTTYYDRKYRYDIEEWVFVVRLITRGNDKKPYWSDISKLNWPIDMNRPQIGNQKGYNAVESYTLFLTEKPHEFVTSFGFWNRFDIEDLVIVTRNGYGFPVDIKAR